MKNSLFKDVSGTLDQQNHDEPGQRIRKSFLSHLNLLCCISDSCSLLICNRMCKYPRKINFKPQLYPLYSSVWMFYRSKIVYQYYKNMDPKKACSYGQCVQFNKIQLIIYKVVELWLCHLSVKYYTMF